MYQRTILPNGIRVVTEHIPYVRSVSLGIWFETGSRDENQSQQGFSHFIEHMMFKGTKKHSARDLAEIMDTSGGHLNAFTGKEHTCYYARVLDEHFSLAADLLQDMLLNSQFAADELEKERGVILEEIKMYEDTPDELVHDLLSEALWRGHPLGNSILGDKESILNVKREDLLSFIKDYYTTDRIVIAAAGNIQHEQVVEQFARGLSQLPHSSPSSDDHPLQPQGESIIKLKDTEQVHLCIGGRALSRKDPRKYAFYLLDTILGGGMSSRLFQELREERGLVYTTYSYHSAYREIGNFGIYAGCSPIHIKEVIDLIHNELGRLSHKKVEAIELERAKSQLKGSLMLSLESTTNRMTRLAKGEINIGNVFTPDEIITAIEKVTVEDIHELARHLYQGNHWSMAIIGPVSDDVRRDIPWKTIG